MMMHLNLLQVDCVESEKIFFTIIFEKFIPGSCRIASELTVLLIAIWNLEIIASSVFAKWLVSIHHSVLSELQNL